MIHLIATSLKPQEWTDFEIAWDGATGEISNFSQVTYLPFVVLYEHCLAMPRPYGLADNWLFQGTQGDVAASPDNWTYQVEGITVGKIVGGKFTVTWTLATDADLAGTVLYFGTSPETINYNSPSITVAAPLPCLIALRLSLA